MNTYKVIIIESWFNSKPIIQFCYGNTEIEAIKRVCSWYQITYNLPTTKVIAEKIN